MPLLEVTQIRQISASIRLTDTTAAQVDQYAAFIHACADDVVEQALTYVFSKDRDFQEFLRTPQARQVTATLRIRRMAAPNHPVRSTAVSLPWILRANHAVCTRTDPPDSIPEAAFFTGCSTGFRHSTPERVLPRNLGSS
jgi:hypothetical protein